VCPNFSEYSELPIAAPWVALAAIAKAAAIIAPYVAVGMTWWIENITQTGSTNWSETHAPKTQAAENPFVSHRTTNAARLD
jgi:hypothetical protein